ncbi:flavoprotein [Bacillus marinisedimentorum]|uniref:flavoprotein n=1 Tax=Bacillus marinisedimentorum TaxID=1821260 RepID=UPI000871DB62|nr:flavoprotein [Bacillus marinisedimentorum]
MSQVKNLLIGISGSINVANIFPYIGAIQQEMQCRLHIMMTPGAQSFMPASTLMHSIDGDVFTDMKAHGEFKMPHVELGQWADAIILLPASANTIARVASGFADEIVSAAILAANEPTIIFPSMYLGMWRKNSVQRNIETLKSDGFYVYQPSVFMEQPDATVDAFSGGSLPSPAQTAEYIKAVVNGQVKLRQN